ncbi:hypothetical protein [Neoroseomonas oryzicola]|uniref:Uncharacterized protein n=1 Tax=Neoroseomonas oryzicola TaxID=535904 RepID=A0A9X9WIP7_9PROT|nr:hypothetical protein [Neoroseomonas oryzicola]MBR0660207.1 hypothetical protein [Neoroseomonas oryzicola]NKE16718.1 hypothetical protein [Neoroseomonas oryzicola]
MVDFKKARSAKTERVEAMGEPAARRAEAAALIAKMAESATAAQQLCALEALLLSSPDQDKGSTFDTAAFRAAAEAWALGAKGNQDFMQRMAAVNAEIASLFDHSVVRAATLDRRALLGIGPGTSAGMQSTIAMELAANMGLMEGAMRHINARVPARLLERATEKLGAEGVTEAVTRALASVATRSELGPWLAHNWGALADVDRETTAEIESL